MADYPLKELTGKTPASTYQNLLQKEGTTILVGGDGNVFLDLVNLTGSSVLSSSYASTASLAPRYQLLLITGSTYPVTSSWANNAVLALTSNTASFITASNVQGRVSLAMSSSNAFTSSYTISSSHAVSSSYSPVEPVYSASISTVKQNTLITGNTYQITSSWSIDARTASLAPNYQPLISTGSLIPITSSWAVNWNSASVISLINTKQNTIITGSLVPVTSSWSSAALLSNTASVVKVVNDIAILNISSSTILQFDSNTIQFGENAAANVGVKQNTIYFGYGAGQNASTSSTSVMIGYLAGQNAIKGDDATLVGYFAGRNATTASDATLIGSSAGSATTQAQLSTMVGYRAGYLSRTASYTTFIGAEADASESTNNVAKSVAIGYKAKVSAPAVMVLGGTGVDAINVGINTTAPTARLQVVGNVVADGFTGSLQGTSSWARNSLSASYALTASYALNGGGSGTSLVTGSTYPITSSWSINAITSDFAPIAFNDVRVIDGKLLIRSEDTNNWFYLSVSDDGSGSYTTQITQSNATGSLLYTGSINCLSASFATTASFSNVLVYEFLQLSSSYASSSFSSSYALTSSYALKLDVVGSVSATGYQLSSGSIVSKTGSYILNNVDDGKMLSFSGSTGVIVVSGSILSSNFSVGVYQSGSTQLSFVTSSGTIIRNRAGYTKTAGQYALTSLIRINGNEFVLGGDVGP
jgi:hypothetical protein